MLSPSFRGGAQHRTRNLEIPGSTLRVAPEYGACQLANSTVLNSAGKITSSNSTSSE
jgi:hypothetical protein